MVEKKYFSVKMLMGAIQYAAEQLSELDDTFKQKLAGIDSITQWKVEPNGPNSYTIVKDLKIKSKMYAIHDNPTYTFILKDLDVALDIFQGKIDAMKAIVEGKIKIVGEMINAQKEMFILETLSEYLSDLTRGE